MAVKDKTIAIATMVGQNQGNRLQNYALEKVLQGITFCDVHTLRVNYGSPVKSVVKSVLAPIKPRTRWARFTDFDNRYIRYSRYTTSDKKLDSRGYAAFVIGSDQVWNPDFSFTSDAEYLPQVDSSRKIAYAASFGVDELGEDEKRIAELLKGVGHIAMREESGCAIVERLTGKEVPLVLDPTMLVESVSWHSIARRPQYIDIHDRYCAKYVLGEDSQEDIITKLANERGLQIINLNDRTLPIGPAEFLWIIENSSLVCTDSYHASVFSILFHRPFLVFDRKSPDKCMSSRLDTLCKEFSLEHRRLSSDSSDLTSIWNEDWLSVDRALGALRNSSLSYLRDSLQRCGVTLRGFQDA